MAKIAFITGKVMPQGGGEAIAELRKLSPVDEVRLTAGKFDFIAKIHFDSFENFFDAYLQVKRIPEIKPIKILVARQNSGEP